MDRAVKKKYCQFFSLVLKTPVSENMDPKELKNFLEQKSRSLLSSPSEDSRINSMIRFIEEHYREDIQRQIFPSGSVCLPVISAVF